MDSTYDCLKAWWKYGYEIEYFWVSGIILVGVGILGLFGNLANLIVLFQSELKKKVFYQLLIVLAIFDGAKADLSLLSKLAMSRVMMLSVFRPDTGTNWLFNRHFNGNFVALFLIFCVTMFLRCLVTLGNSVR